MPSKIETEAAKNAFALDEADRFLDCLEQIDPRAEGCVGLLRDRLRSTQKMLDDYRDLDVMLCK